MSEVTHTSTAVMCSVIQSLAALALSPTRTMLTFAAPRGRIGRELIGDNENIEPKARCHAINFLADRACVTIDIDVSQLSARFVLGSSLPISHSCSFDQRRRFRAPLTAIASAFRCTTSRLPRVTPV
jgi:hypothetical protein